MPRFLIVFPCGLEDVVKKELEEKISINIVEENPQGVPGRIVIDVPASDALKLSSLRSVEWFLEYIGAFQTSMSQKGLEKIYGEIMGMEFPSRVREAASFRVTCRKRGEHEYTSLDVQRKAGQALVEKYRLKVDLEDFDVNVLLDIVGNTCFVGLFKNDYAFSRYIVFNHPASLRPSIAYGMVRIADPKPGMAVLDPMCGGGIIPIETALTVDGVKTYGFDVSEYFLEGAALNAEAMSVADRIIFKKVDCRRLSKYLRFRVDRIITDPPYGTKPVARIKPYSFYSKCLLEMKKALGEDGKIVLITIKPGHVREISSKIGLSLEHERVVKHGDAWSSIMVLASS